MPFIYVQVRRGFEQDCIVLKSEQHAFDHGFRTQMETNPAIPALHSHVERFIAERVVGMSVEIGRQRDQRSPEQVDRNWVLETAGRGEVVMINLAGGHSTILHSDELSASLPTGSPLSVYRYGPFLILPGK